jgi:hypothetical protein
MNTYGPSEFIQKLSANDLPDSDELKIAGLVKHDAETYEVIQFSTSMSCENWLSIATTMTADITHLRNVKCNDHRHPLVTIRLKQPLEQPDAAQTELAFLFGLVSELQRTVARLTRSKTTRGQVTPLHFDDCYTVIDDGKVKVCCGNPPECTGVADLPQ